MPRKKDLDDSEQSSAYRVLEFRPQLTSDQKQFLDRCLEPMRQLWNAIVLELESFEKMSWKDKLSNTRVACCPLPWERRSLFIKDNQIVGEVSDSEAKSALPVYGCREVGDRVEWIGSDKVYSYQQVEGKLLKYLAPYSPILDSISRRFVRNAPDVRNYTTLEGWQKAGKGVYTAANLSNVRGWESEPGLTFYSCPVRFYKEPYFSSTNFTGKNCISRLVAVKKNPVLPLLVPIYGIDPFIFEVPSDFLYGLVESAATAWNEYEKSKRGYSSIVRGKPRLKKYSEQIDTLSSGKSGTARMKGKDLIQLPKLGCIAVSGLTRRWPAGEEIKRFKLTKRIGGYYLQLTTDRARAKRQTKSTKVSAIDPGLRSYLTFDDGRKVENPRYYRKSEEQLAKLQQQLDAKLIHNLILWLNHPTRSPNDLIAQCPHLSEARAVAVLGAKGEIEIVSAIGMSYFGRLKHTAGKSKRTDAIQHKISRLHEKIRNQRKHFIHKQTTWHVRTHGTLICEDGMQSPNLKAKSKSVLNEDKTGFERNNAKAKSGLSKSLSDTGYGMYLSLLEAKAKASGKKVIKHPARFTTQQCPICDKKNKILLSETWYQCPDCGFESDRDQKAAIAMIVSVFEQGAVEWEALSEPVQKVIQQRQAYKERCLVDVQSEVIPQKSKRSTRKRRSA